MGRTHVLSGAAAWLALAPPVAARLGQPLRAGELVAGAVVCAGAAVLPDLDTPGSTIARSLGPVTGVLARVLGAVAGGHRNGTHSLLFVVAVWAGLTAALRSPTGDAVALGVSLVCVALGVRAAGPPELRGGRFLDRAPLGTAVALVALGWATVGTAWLPAAVAAGSLAHVAGDLLTDRGVRLLWPLRARQALPVLTTGGPLERVAAAACTAAIVWFGYVALRR